MTAGITSCTNNGGKTFTVEGSIGGLEKCHSAAGNHDLPEHERHTCLHCYRYGDRRPRRKLYLQAATCVKKAFVVSNGKQPKVLPIVKHI